MTKQELVASVRFLAVKMNAYHAADTEAQRLRIGATVAALANEIAEAFTTTKGSSPTCTNSSDSTTSSPDTDQPLLPISPDARTPQSAAGTAT